MAQAQVVSYPTPIYQNPPINPQYFQPSRFVISAVTLGQTTTITTTTSNNYVIGQTVSFVIHPYSGISQLNGLYGIVIQIPTNNQVVVNINSSNFNPFISTSVATPPQIVAIGSFNSGAINASGRQVLSTLIPGSFINISPL